MSTYVRYGEASSRVRSNDRVKQSGGIPKQWLRGNNSYNAPDREAAGQVRAASASAWRQLVQQCEHGSAGGAGSLPSGALGRNDFAKNGVQE